MRYVSEYAPEDGWHDMEALVHPIAIVTFADLAGRTDSNSHWADGERAYQQEQQLKKKKRKKRK